MEREPIGLPHNPDEGVNWLDELGLLLAREAVEKLLAQQMDGAMAILQFEEMMKWLVALERLKGEVGNMMSDVLRDYDGLPSDWWNMKLINIMPVFKEENLPNILEGMLFEKNLKILKPDLNRFNDWY